MKYCCGLKFCGLFLIFALIIVTGAAWAEQQQCEEDDVECWLKLLERNDAQALRASMQLGRLQAEEAIPLLIKKLASSDQYQATAALHALIRIGKPAVLPLIEATKHEKPAVRRFATYALGKIGNGDAFDAVALLARDEDATVRRQAAVALGMLGERRGLTMLVGLLRDRHVKVRVAAAEAIGKIGDPKSAHLLIEYGLCDLSPQVARAASQALVSIGEPAAQPLLENLNQRPVFARKRILITLGNIGATASPQLKKQIVRKCIVILKRVSERIEIRTVAAYELGSLEDKEAIEALKIVMDEANQMDCQEAEKLVKACRVALEKIYQKYNMTPDF